MNHKSVNTESIRQLLNRSVARLDPPTLKHLVGVRTQALDRYGALATQPVFAWAGFGHFGHSRMHYWASAALLAFFLLGAASYWQQTAEHDNSDVDIAILTDDLPMDVYVD